MHFGHFIELVDVRLIHKFLNNPQVLSGMMTLVWSLFGHTFSICSGDQYIEPLVNGMKLKQF